MGCLGDLQPFITTVRSWDPVFQVLLTAVSFKKFSEQTEKLIIVIIIKTHTILVKVLHFYLCGGFFWGGGEGLCYLFIYLLTYFSLLRRKEFCCFLPYLLYFQLQEPSLISQLWGKLLNSTACPSCNTHPSCLINLGAGKKKKKIPQGSTNLINLQTYTQIDTLQLPQWEKRENHQQICWWFFFTELHEVTH